MNNQREAFEQKYPNYAAELKNGGVSSGDESAIKTYLAFQSGWQAAYEALQKENAELAKQAQRYEIVRKFNLRQFTDIYVENLSGGARFDDLVDNFKP